MPGLPSSHTTLNTCKYSLEAQPGELGQGATESQEGLNKQHVSSRGTCLVPGKRKMLRVKPSTVQGTNHQGLSSSENGGPFLSQRAELGEGQHCQAGARTPGVIPKSTDLLWKREKFIFPNYTLYLNYAEWRSSLRHVCTKTQLDQFHPSRLHLPQRLPPLTVTLLL